MKILLVAILVVLIWLQPCSVTSAGQTAKHLGPDIVDVSLCDLIADPSRFAGQHVRVRAVYRYGFEWSELYSLRCDSGARGRQVWVEFGDEYERTTKRSVRRQVGNHGAIGRTVGVVAIGTVQQGGYGHMGVYALKFEISRLESARILMQESPSPSALPAVARKRVEDFEDGAK